MLVWLIYDISINKTRNKIIKYAEQKGLYRVQKSVFLGNITKNDFDELKLQSEELINKKTDSVYIFPLCEKDFKAVITLGKAFDQELVTDEIKAMFI